jgi:hypothetical protein
MKQTAGPAGKHPARGITGAGATDDVVTKQEHVRNHPGRALPRRKIRKNSYIGSIGHASKNPTNPPQPLQSISIPVVIQRQHYDPIGKKSRSQRGKPPQNHPIPIPQKHSMSIKRYTVKPHDVNQLPDN